MDVNFTDNSEQVLKELADKIHIALDSVGSTAAGYAQDGAPVDTGNLRNSITHEVGNDEVNIGTNVEYAVYQEYGTGIYAEDGSGRQTPWFYEGSDGKMHMTYGSKPHHFLKNSVMNHQQEYQRMIETIMKQ